MRATLQKLAQAVSAEIEGDDQYLIQCVSGIQNASEDSIAYFDTPKLSDYLSDCTAGAIITCPSLKDYVSGNKLIHPSPRAAYAIIANILHPDAQIMPGIHASAIIETGAIVHPTAQINANVVVESGANIGGNVFVGSNSVIGRNTRIGEDTRIDANVSVYNDCVVGHSCRLATGVVIGAQGFGYEWYENIWYRIPQLGRVVVGDYVDIGANTTIDRGTNTDTVIGSGVKMDNQIQIGHNVTIGEHTIMAGCVAVAGSATIGRRCRFGGRASILGHLEIVDDVQINATSMVTHSITKPGAYSSTLPVQPHAQWRRTLAQIRRLDKTITQFKSLTKSFKHRNKRG